jgi:membrane-associated protein
MSDVSGGTPQGAVGLRRDRRIAPAVAAATAVLLVAAVVLHLLDEGDGLGLVTTGVGSWAYAAVAALIFADAVCPIFPGETTLNAASTLAAADELGLGLVMLAGAVGAIAGDSALFWIARRAGRRLRPQVERARSNSKVRLVFDIVGENAPVLIVGGRYVPGARFAVNATMGLSDMPYRRFLPWSALSGAIWSVYTCGLAFVVGTALSDFPLASIVISGLITTIALVVIFVVLRRRRAATA